MEFTLHYRGELKANRGAKEKQAIRRVFHKQMKILWSQSPLVDQKDLIGEQLADEPAASSVSILQTVGPFTFAPLVTSRLHGHADLSITMLRPEPPGSIVTHGGDLDNRLKTLLDALKMPSEDELHTGDSPQVDEHPFFCLLEDDALVSRLSVSTDRLLEPSVTPSEVELLIHVTTKYTKAVWANVGL